MSTVVAEEWVFVDGNILVRLSSIGYFSRIDFCVIGTSGDPLEIIFLTFASFSVRLVFSFGFVSPPPRPVTPSRRESARPWRELEPDLAVIIPGCRTCSNYSGMSIYSSL